MLEKLALGDLLATIVYSMLGIVLALLSYRIFNFSVPFDLTKELEDDQNVALGIVCGAMMLGVAIIIAAAISS
ncbi:MAG: DUF350 domain-containing protein [Deltaproteobacteria bacterium]|nr:MAG: DUF350 domain-containing protein [Deltaproteobacteria bacterium]